MLRVRSLGEVVLSDEFYVDLQGKAIVVPSGYRVEMPVFATQEKQKEAVKLMLQPSDEEAGDPGELFFIISVSVAPSHVPLYTVTRSDSTKAAVKTYKSEKTAHSAIRDALHDVERDFPEKASMINVPRDDKSRFLVMAPRVIGLSLSLVKEAIRQLPHGSEAFSASEAKLHARKQPKAPPAQGKVKATVVEDAPAVVCADCGLAGTPFCAATGKEHATPAPCLRCGLTSTFCPVTGEQHQGVASRPNRRRGEVKLPASNSSRRKVMAKGSADGSFGGTLEPMPKKRRVEGGAVGAEKSHGESDQIPLAEFFKPALPVAPRPALAAGDQAKASALLQKALSNSLRAEDVVTPPFVDELRLTAADNRPARKTRQTRKEGGEGARETNPSAAGHALSFPSTDQASCKRFVKFTTQFTSERSKLDLLRQEFANSKQKAEPRKSSTAVEV